ncbi:conserved hypothetical protein [Rhodococcus sp. RD6.2]|nr:conserved hypothetical protein [Rhodococcus sp. RD6.2]
MTDPDLSRLPMGQREWRGLIDALSELDDRAERHFLELKSQIDLSSTGGGAKVAKFILGAANRDPEQASKRLAGHALMVLGVSQGSVSGLPFFEAKDLEDIVKKYIGDDGPRWDFERVRVDQDRDIIVIKVDPPRPGDPVYTCYKDGPENLKNGGIYIRLDGQTREARGGEVRTLLKRAASARPSANIAVSITGTALPFRCSPQILDSYVMSERTRLEAAYTETIRKESAPMTTTSVWALATTASVFGTEPEDRSLAEYRAEIDEWEAAIRASWVAFLDDAASAVWPCARVRVRNLRKTFMEGVEVKIHLAGPVEAVAKPHDDDDVTKNLPAPPRPWGPRDAQPYTWMAAHQPRLHDLQLPPSAYQRDSVVFTNSGSVDLELTLNELRPDATYNSDDGEFVLVLRSTEADRITGTWTATARDHHELFEGELSVEVADDRDFSAGIRRLLTSGG